MENIWVITEYTNFKNAVHQWFFIDRKSAEAKFEALKLEKEAESGFGIRPGSFIAISGPHESGAKIDTVYGTNEIRTWTSHPYTNTQAV